MTSVVLDASAGVEALLQGDKGVRVEAAIADSTLWVPEHFYVEVTATLRRLQLLGEIRPERSAVAMDRLLAIPTRRVQIRPLISEAWVLRDNITIADALYVVIARHVDATLVTFDTKLAAAPTLGIAVHVP